ncbi:MAG: alpha/beta hydrolase [Bacteroidaceae bacterium]|nr:alpha/beta hydrolase [Bacteroidaceae bacterium]
MKYARHHGIKACLTLLLACVATLVSAQNYRTASDIAFTQSADPYAQERCRLDVYYPEGKQKCPVVVWFHGGGIEGGSKHLPDELREQGLVVVSANYRLLPKVPVDSTFRDVAEAVAWTFRNVEQYGGDPTKIYLAGHSAGGYLLTMVGLDKTYLAQCGVDADQVRALVPFSGQMITHYNHRKMHGIDPLQPVIDKYAPLYHVRKNAPPLLLISGDRELELYGRYEENAYMYRMMKLVGHPHVALYELDGHDHGAMVHPAFHILLQYIHADK